MGLNPGLHKHLYYNVSQNIKQIPESYSYLDAQWKYYISIEFSI